MSEHLDKRRHPWRDDLAAQSLRGRVKAPRYVKGEPRQITCALAGLRKAPGPGAMLLTQGLMGESFSIYDQQGEWAWGQLETDGYVGYMHTRHLRADPAAPSHFVHAARSHIYPQADIKSTPLACLSMMAKIHVVGQQGIFAQLQGGGYMIASHLRPVDKPEDDFVEVAARFLNTPYLWGGRSASGIDCSALVQVALAACGVAAPRDSDMQEAELFTSLPGGMADNVPARGDLVFWPGHVGIMWSQTELLHANGHHMMTVIEPLKTAILRIEPDNGPPRRLKRGPA